MAPHNDSCAEKLHGMGNNGFVQLEVEQSHIHCFISRIREICNDDTVDEELRFLCEVFRQTAYLNTS